MLPLETFKVTIQSLFIICAVYLLFSIPATLLYGSLKDPNGASLLQSNIIANLPSSSPWAVFINILMGLSCLCSMPVLLSSTTELLEKNCRVYVVVSLQVLRQHPVSLSRIRSGCQSGLLRLVF